MGIWSFRKIVNPARKPPNGRWVSAAQAEAHARAAWDRAEQLAARRPRGRRVRVR